MLITRNPEMFVAALRGQNAPQAAPPTLAEVSTPRGLPLAAAFLRHQQAARDAEALRKATTPGPALETSSKE